MISQIALIFLMTLLVPAVAHGSRSLLGEREVTLCVCVCVCVCGCGCVGERESYLIHDVIEVSINL